MNSGVIQSTPGINNTPDIISGILRVNKRLTAATVSATTINSIATGKISYKWQRCDTSSGGCVDIPKATRTTYTTVSDDRNKYLRVVATARNNASVPDVTTAVSAESKLIL